MAEQASVSLINCAGREAIAGEKFCESENYNVRLNVFGSFPNLLLRKLSKKSGGNYFVIDTNDEKNFSDIFRD